MAVKVGKRSEEGSFKLYQGVGAFNILAVNPDKATLSKLTGREIENEPEYLGKTDDGKPYVRVVFWVGTDPTAKVNNGIKLLTSFSFMITNEFRVGQTSGKTQVIDKFGRTAWATEDDLKTGAIPQYANGPANISEGYRPAYQGEENLIDFLIQWLNIPSPMDYTKDKKWVMKKDTSDCEVSLDMKKLLTGDVSELSSLVSIAANYAVKACIGVRTSDDNKQYQQVYIQKFLKNAVNDYSKLDADIQGRKASGGYPTTEFDVQPLHEYNVDSTDFSNPDNDPLGANQAPAASPWDAWQQG